MLREQVWCAASVLVGLCGLARAEPEPGAGQSEAVWAAENPERGAEKPAPGFEALPAREASGTPTSSRVGGGILYAPSQPDSPEFRAAVTVLSGSPCDYFDARTATPDLELLAGYRCVFTWTNYSYADRLAFGDNLADYVDGGGAVVLGQWTYSGFASAGGVWFGRIIEPGYCPVDAYSFSSGAYAGDGTSCLTEGVGSWLTPFRDNATLRDGAQSDGTYTDGVPFIAYYPGVKVSYVPGLLFGGFGEGPLEEGARVVVKACTCPRLKGDVDVDGDVDLDDYGSWDGCMTGPTGGPPDPGCGVFDFEPDGDVDLADYAALQEALAAYG